jgi:hypothetical protein
MTLGWTNGTQWATADPRPPSPVQLTSAEPSRRPWVLLAGGVVLLAGALATLVAPSLGSRRSGGVEHPGPI